VNVIDVDSVLYRLTSQNMHALHNVMVNVQCADVVLLNKVDLVDDSGIKTVRAWVDSIQPGIPTYQTERCYLGLERIMDVEEVREEAMLTHEKRESRLQVRSVGQTIRREKEKLKHHEQHDHYQSFVFESQRPISILRFQAFLKCMQNFARVKGFIWFREFGNIVWTFQISGRQRYSLEHNRNSVGAPKNVLVFIGPTFFEDILKKRLEACHVDMPFGTFDQGMSFMASQTAFEVLVDFSMEEGLDETAMTSSSLGIWPFRLIASVKFGIPEHSIGAKGIDLNGTNESIQKAVNTRGILMPGMNVNGQYRLYFVCGENDALDVWKILESEANRVLYKTFGKLARCSL